jgi:hypothetical protein
MTRNGKGAVNLEPASLTAPVESGRSRQCGVARIGETFGGIATSRLKASAQS